MIDLARLFRRNEPAPADVFGFAVVGLGRIAEHFLKAVADSPTVRATALVSGDAVKAQKLAKQYQVAHTSTYADFDSLRDNADVHAVYLALPVSMHREFTARAAAAGKHVLVEKPMANTAADCRAMIADCRAAGVLLSVAYRCPYDPSHQKLRDLLRSGALGTVRRIDSQFGFPLDPADWRFQPGLAGGGSLYDVGIYPLNAARFMLGEEPVEETATATTDGNGLETSIEWTSRFPRGTEVHCRSSYLEKLDDTFTVTGTSGTLSLKPAFSHREHIGLRGHYTDPATGRQIEVNETTPREMPSHFRLEAEHLAACVRSGSALLTPGEDGLHDLEAMEQIYTAAGVCHPAETVPGGPA